MDRVRDTTHGALAIELVRALAQSGMAWDEITFRDDLEALIGQHVEAGGPRGRLIRQCEAAYTEGHREHLRKTWVTRWTTAPSDYDWFGTATVADAGTWCGKPLREVLIDPHELRGQEERYGSGLHGSWAEDPNVEEARAQARYATEQAERAAREAKQAEGIAWLSTLSETELDRVTDGDMDDCLDRYGIGWTAVRAERDKRAQARAERKRSEAWAHCRPLIPDDCALVDDGDPGGYYEACGFGYRRPRRDARVYYGIRVVEVERDAERSYVQHSGRDSLGSVADVAHMLGNGRLRVAQPSEVPPQKVLDRIGHDQLGEIKRLDVAGRVVWVGRARFSYEPLILDENGRIVRAKAVKDAVANLEGART
jgi:hypothetical protein